LIEFLVLKQSARFVDVIIAAQKERQELKDDNYEITLWSFVSCKDTVVQEYVKRAGHCETQNNNPRICNRILEYLHMQVHLLSNQD